jgi:hypothetical protein
MDNNMICTTAMKWQTAGRRKTGRSKTTRRRKLKKERDKLEMNR